MGNERYLPQLFLAAQKYQAALLGKNLLIIAQRPKGKGYTYIETVFLARHFMHLTGCKGISGISSVPFFELCLNKRLGPEQFSVVPETSMKLRVLPMLCNLAREAKMMGRFNDTGDYLYTETLTGGLKGCIGFVTEAGSKYLSPNTVLEEDIRTLVVECWQVMAIYEKALETPLYPNTPKYLAKALKPYADRLIWPVEIEDRIECL